MPSRLVRSFLAFALPGGLILLAAVGFLRPRGLPDWLHQPASTIPYIVLAFGLIFGWHLSSSRLTWSFLILASVERAMTCYPVAASDPDSLGLKIFATTAFLLPLNLVALSLLKEEAFSVTRNLTRLVLVSAQALLVLWLCSPGQQELAASFSQNPIGWPPTGWTPVPQPALAAFILAGSIHLTQFLLKRDPMEAGSFWALAALFLAYHGTRSGWQPTNFFSSAGLILFLSLLQSVHRRAYRDELTGIAGPQAYEEALQQLRSRYAFAVLALDQLKVYASTHGKSVAEQVLKAMAPLIQSACRGATVYRVSGDELIILFPGCSAVETLPALEDIRKRVEETALILSVRDQVRKKGRRPLQEHERELPVTVSGGVAEPVKGATVATVQKAAYRALYEAKSSGGNVMKRASAVFEESRRSSGSERWMVANERS